MTFRTLFNTIALTGAFAASALTARAGAPCDTPAQVAAAAPANADIVFVIVNASQLRADAFGDAVIPLVADALQGSELGAAWVALAQRMGWSPDATFDALLGNRVLFVARSEQGKALRWAVAADVSVETERRLRERLDVAPRVIVGGKPILSVEQGRFELISERSRHGARIVLAPSGERGMLDEMAFTARRDVCTKRLGDAPEFEDLTRLPGGDALLFVRMPAPVGGWAGVSVMCEESGLRAHVQTRPEMAMIGAAEVAPWSRTVFDRLAHDALGALMEWRPRVDSMPETYAPLFNMLPPLDENLGAIDAVGERYAVVVRHNDAGAPTVSAAIELRDSAAFAPVGDAIIANLLARIGLDGNDFAALAPDDTRTVCLAPASDRIDEHAGAVAKTLNLAEVSVSWAFRSDAHDLVAFGGDSPGAGWWVVALDRGAFEHAALALCGAARDNGDARKWLSLGMARPAAIVKSLDRIGGAPSGLTLGPGKLSGAMRVLRHIEHVEWSTELVSDHEQASEVVVRLRPGR